MIKLPEYRPDTEDREFDPPGTQWNKMFNQPERVLFIKVKTVERLAAVLVVGLLFTGVIWMIYR